MTHYTRTLTHADDKQPIHVHMGLVAAVLEREGGCRLYLCGGGFVDVDECADEVLGKKHKGKHHGEA